MRIAYLSYEYPPDSDNGGIATYLAQATRMMSARGHEIEVFSSSPSREGRFENNGILEHLIRETNRKDFGIVAGHVFAARHAEKPFDVLEGPEYNADARKAVELVPGIPLVLKMHTPTLMVVNLNAPSELTPYLRHLYFSFRTIIGSFVKGRVQRPFYFTLPYLQDARDWDEVEKAHAREATLIAPPCRDLCRYATTSWHLPEDAIRLAPHPYTPSKDFLSLQPRADGLTVGYVGRLEKRKGIETFVAAIPAILNAVPQARFRLIGAPMFHPETQVPYDEWIRRKMPQYADRLEIVGKVSPERMAEAYGSLDICVIPSVWENFPNVCLEAMSAARAIVASSAGGMPDMLDQGQAGRLVAPGNPSLLAQEVISLLKSPAERLRLGQNARKRVIEAYNETVIGGLMEEIYCEAIERKTGKNGKLKPANNRQTAGRG
jgi:glycogen(starch) synthase